MIKICYAPGCYGNYLGQCLYFFTNLATDDAKNFTVDSQGSSHGFFTNTKAHQHIQIGHFINNKNNSWPNITVSNNDVLVYIEPSRDHLLDYYNNMFLKVHHRNLSKLISESFIAEEINFKLQTNWGYASFDEKTPRWILREFLSLCIGDILQDMYKLQDINDAITWSTQSFFINFIENFKNLCEKLDLTIVVNDSVILENNQIFKSAQCYHSSQLACEQWIQCTIDNTPSVINLMTILSEAYIQYRFRELGYHIQCDGLDVFPIDSQTMTKLIYKI